MFSAYVLIFFQQPNSFLPSFPAIEQFPTIRSVINAGDAERLPQRDAAPERGIPVEETESLFSAGQSCRN
jgi:hypothetical protein